MVRVNPEWWKMVLHGLLGFHDYVYRGKTIHTYWHDWQCSMCGSWYLNGPDPGQGKTPGQGRFAPQEDEDG